MFFSCCWGHSEEGGRAVLLPTAQVCAVLGREKAVKKYSRSYPEEFTGQKVEDGEERSPSAWYEICHPGLEVADHPLPIQVMTVAQFSSVGDC